MRAGRFKFFLDAQYNAKVEMPLGKIRFDRNSFFVSGFFFFIHFLAAMGLSQHVEGHMVVGRKFYGFLKQLDGFLRVVGF